MEGWLDSSLDLIKNIDIVGGRLSHKTKTISNITELFKEKIMYTVYDNKKFVPIGLGRHWSTD